ncbi:MAG: hypothetical protein HY541_07530 [Deltaproteobacteria bacterium]|nr:hypothetical protein [Deltaproteobacteria bacterium]
MSVKPPSGLPPSGMSQPAQPADGAKKSSAASSTPPTVNPEAVAKALKDYQKMQKNLKKPFISGAAGLFTDNVVFPADLLDPENPANDPKYLHLYSAVLNLKELARFFAVNEQREEMEEEEKEEEEEQKK